MRKRLFYSFALSLACLAASAQSVPVADLLDVQFNSDGTAVDVSAMKNTVEHVGETSSVAYHPAFGHYVATFNNPWSTTCTSWYKVDFESNEAFRNALADGHSLEMLVKGHYDGTIANAEAKPFSAMQGGGTGFLICKTNSSGRQNEWTFLPNVTTSGSSTWRWTNSGVVPESDVYYHVIGVWNKEEQKAYIYVDGELKNTVDAPGEFRFANSGCNWFCVGGDADSSGGGQGWNGDVVLARVYDKPLSTNEVGALWDAVAEQEKKANMMPKISLASGTYQGEQTITLTAKNNNSIYYTLDGSEPNDATGTLYEAPITISETTVLKAIAVDDEDFASAVATAEYVFTTKKVYLFTKVTSMNELVNGGDYVMGAMVNGSVKVACPVPATKTYGYLQIVDATETAGTLQLDTKDNAFTVTLTAQGAQIKDVFGRFLQQKGTYNSFNVETDETAEGLFWGASFNEDGTIVITNLNVNKYIQYSIGHGSYGSYPTAQDNAALPSLYIFKGVDFVEISEPETTPSYSSISELQEAATTTSTQIQLTINNWYVSGVNGSQFFLTDGSGLGIVGYEANHGFLAGDRIKGTVLCNLVLYKQLGELTGLTALTEGLVVTNSQEVPAVTTAPGQLTGANQGALVSLCDLYFEDGKLFDANGASVTPYNTFKIENMPVFEKGAYYDITGVVVIYNNTVEIAPLSADQVQAVNVMAEYVFNPGWSTFICPYDVTLFEELEAFVVDGVENDVLVLGPVNNIIPANTPVVISAKSISTIAVNGNKVKPVSNTVGLLTGVYEDTAAPAGSYVLQKLNDQVAFYPVQEEKPITVPAGRCYLMPGVVGVKAFMLNEATGIENIQGASVQGEMFDLAGRRVSNPTKGIYIVNGKKVLK
ncbi:MAG: chitobiase/beta-hexosaminidase C-terminal domain-containing protein [Bacteroidaceae bacterium]|nr:chitobiase/beta-hexosaminidase C-terminal domain-containing protein [Bacteroidaceae bacterium]